MSNRGTEHDIDLGVINSEWQLFTSDLLTDK